MSTASFKFWFPRFFLYFLLLIHNDSLRFKNILLPQAPCKELITTSGGQEQSIGCFRANVNSCLIPVFHYNMHTSLCHQINRKDSSTFRRIFWAMYKPYYRKERKSWSKIAAQSKLYPSISKESAPKRQVTSPSQRRPGSLATNNMASTQLSQMVSLC